MFLSSLLFRLSLVAVMLATSVASAGDPITNQDIQQMQRQHERNPGYTKSPTSSKLPSQLAAMKYQRPAIKDWLLPYTDWEQKDRVYFKRNYGENKLTLNPKMIVMHYTVIPSSDDTYHALVRKQVSVHYMVGTDGKVYRLLPDNRRCTGAYGVDHLALSIEMVAQTEPDLLSRAHQVFTSFCLVRHLMEQHDIPLGQVVAHYEVGQGRRRVPEYTDLYDTVYPDGYPPAETRTDPGPTYMSWLRTYLKENPPTR